MDTDGQGFFDHPISAFRFLLSTFCFVLPSVVRRAGFVCFVYFVVWISGFGFCTFIGSCSRWLASIARSSILGGD